MGRLANISGTEAVKAFGRAGWQIVGQVGSHVFMSKQAVRANLSIPQHKETLDRNASRVDSRGRDDG